MRKTIRHVAVLAAAVVMLTAIAAPAQAKGGGDRDRCSVKNLRTGVTSDDLQSQIDAAAYGDTLKIRGVCVGNFSITGGNLTLLGKERAGVPAVTLDANGSREVLVIRSASVTLTDLMITGAVEALGAIVADDNSVVALNGSSQVSGNWSSLAPAGGIWVSRSSLTLNDTAQVSGNEAGMDGGGIAVEAGQVTLNGSAQVSGNTADGMGGGIYAYSSTVTLNGSAQVSGNHSHYGGGICSWDGTLLLSAFSSVQVSDNTADRDGGGIYIGRGTASMTWSSTVIGNTADADDNGYGTGGGIYGCVTGAVAGSNVYDNYRGTTSPVPDDIANGC